MPKSLLTAFDCEPGRPVITVMPVIVSGAVPVLVIVTNGVHRLAAEAAMLVSGQVTD